MPARVIVDAGGAPSSLETGATRPVPTAAATNPDEPRDAGVPERASTPGGSKLANQLATSVNLERQRDRSDDADDPEYRYGAVGE